MEKQGYFGVSAQRVEWTPYEDIKPTIAVCTDVSGEQPGFSFEIAWNEPRKWWRPFIVLKLWRLRLQLGWLY